MGSAAAQFQPSPAEESSRSDVLYQAAPLHYVNIGTKLAGDYRFGYETGRGPTGQSYREETRLADGTVKGSYGVIDENGHKRVFHYSAGNGNFITQSDSKPTASLPFVTLQRQPKLITQRNFNTFPPQLPVFKPANYLQSRAAQPVKMVPISEKSETNEPLVKKLKLANKVKKISAPVYRLPAHAQRVYKTTTPVHLEQTTVPPTELYGVSQAVQQDSVTALADMYKNLKRMPKKPIYPTKQTRIQVKTNESSEKSSVSNTEEDYYDSVPAFIDIERLSYSIGTDKSSSL